MCFLIYFDGYLPAQDCAVSDWSHWSGCAKPCQLSVRSRVRHIEQKPTNGGEPCPALEERAGCKEYRDHRGSRCGHNSGVQTEILEDFLTSAAVFLSLKADSLL